MAHIDILPLGSIVLLNGNPTELMIIGRGLRLKINGKEVFSDYAGVQYPDGHIGDKVAYFDHDRIAKDIFKGYSEERDAIVVENINNYVASNEIVRMDQVQNV